jgi:hypothetical protein
VGRELGDGNCVVWGTGRGFIGGNGCMSLGGELLCVGLVTGNTNSRSYSIRIMSGFGICERNWVCHVKERTQFDGV